MGETPISRIVLTGGPCGGKSTCLSLITERMQGLGFQVYRVPETATLMLGGGVSLRDASPTQVVNVQEGFLRVMMSFEDAFLSIARSRGKPAILLCDRGTMDVAAYLSREAWGALLDEQNWSVVGLRDRRYEAVIHLVTAADGAEAFYTTDNNTVRSESPAQARELDRRVRDAWVGHPSLRIIDNSTDFAGKVQRVVAAVSHIVGVPEPRQIERKFLLGKVRKGRKVPVRIEEFDIEQTYLLSQDGWEARVRRRSQQGASTYTHTLKRPAVDGQRVRIERQITGREFMTFLAQADPGRRTLRKTRRSFLWANRYFAWDVFLDPRPGLELLEVEVDDLDSEVELPPFLKVVEEVTHDKQYANHTIALG
jgi:CYTH domain-containing protein